MKVYLEKLAWIKKITARQIAGMCMVMVAIYFISGRNEAQVETNFVGSIGYSYQDDDMGVEVHTVYLQHESGYLAKTEIVACEQVSAVESIFTGIQDTSERLPEQTIGLIPANAVLYNYTIEDDVLTLNLSESFLYYFPSLEENLLSSLVWSMTELPEVNRVHLEIEDEAMNNLNTSIDVSRGLTRAMGINLEVGALRVDDSQMMMLYFLTDDTDDALLIPVTRLVNNNVNPFEYAVSALVRGPIGASYISVFNHRAMLLEQPRVEEGILTLNFSSDLFYNQEQTQVSSQVIRQLVMTMTEFEEVSEVSVVIEGSSRVFDDVGNPITVPVNRNHILGLEARVGGYIREY